MRTNDFTEAAIQDLLGTDNKVGKLHKFIVTGNGLDPNQEKFIEIINEIMPSLKELGALEEIILQTRAWSNLKKEDIKLTVSREQYLYARAPFYRKNNAAKEIRVLVGKIDDWMFILNEKDPTNIDALYNDDTFMTIAFNGLNRAMEIATHETADRYKRKFEKEKA